MYEELKNHGVTEETPKNIMLGAGTLHKNLIFGYYEPCDSTTANKLKVVADSAAPTDGEIKLSYAQKKCSVILKANDYVQLVNKWNFAASLIGATSGGNKLSIVPEILTVEVDGALVKVKGLDFKQGETAKLETNLVEITPELLKTTVIGKLVESNIEGYDLIESKSSIESGDYYENLGFVGKKGDGTPIIIIFDNALCTSGFEDDAKNKDKAVIKCTFECYQEPTEDLSKLPYHIYYPSQT